jgi:error-prone DNA polymerase
MTKNGIGQEAQDSIVQGISSFAMYGFPESHAASFALIAYASAYLKVHYLAAFTCGLLNNQPMGFYAPAVLIKDAQRHGLKVRPIDVQRSEYLCTLEHEADGVVSLRVGLNYAKGLRKAVAEKLVSARISDGEFASVEDVARRVPELNRKELVLLARIGALNSVGDVEHRRDALWQVEQAGRPLGPLLRHAEDRDIPGPQRLGTGGTQGFRESHGTAQRPLRKMTTDERLAADFAGTGLTTGPHPMAYVRAELQAQGLVTANDLTRCANEQWVRIAGCVIARQRPGTAKGFVFLSLEDETGIANVIVTPDVFEANRVTVTRSRFLRVEGRVQQQDGVIHVKAQKLETIVVTTAETRSHDFH